MTRSTSQATSMIKVSALIVAGVYFYRRFTEGTAEELKASKKLTPLGRFAVGWGVVYLGLSLAAQPFPQAAGDMAILLALGSVLTNGVEVSKDLNKGLGATKGKIPTDTQGSGRKATTATVPTTEPTSPFTVRSA